MKKWQKNKTYIYYVPEFDFVYTAEVVDDPQIMKTIRYYPDFFRNSGPTVVNFNPDVTGLYTMDFLRCIFPETVYIGEL